MKSKSGRGGPPPFVQYFDRLAAISMTLAERAVCLAAAHWLNFQTWELWPSVEAWARLAGLTARSTRRALRRLEGRGFLKVVRSSRGGRGVDGRGKTTKYMLLLPEITEPVEPDGEQPGPARREPSLTASPHPDTGVIEPGRTVSRSSIEPPEEQIQQQVDGPAAAVARLLGSEKLLRHTNATSERLAWIAREAPSKVNPSAWAAEAIRKGYSPPTRRIDAKEAANIQRAAILRSFDAMNASERKRIVEQARQQFPNLVDPKLYPDTDPAVRGAVARTLMKRAMEPCLGDGTHSDPSLSRGA